MRFTSAIAGDRQNVFNVITQAIHYSLIMLMIMTMTVMIMTMTVMIMFVFFMAFAFVTLENKKNKK